MPFCKRIILPSEVCKPDRRRLQRAPHASHAELFGDLVDVCSFTLGSLLRQLSDLSRHSVGILQELEGDLVSVCQRSGALEGRVVRLQRRVAELVSRPPPKEEPDILMQGTAAPGPSAKDKETKKGSKGKRPKRGLDSAQDSDEEPDLLMWRTAAPGPSAQDKVIEKRGTDKLQRKRRPWSWAEKAAICRQLGQFITLHRVPGKEQCLKALEAEPILHTRSWKDIKNRVSNCIAAQKRKF